MDDEYESNRAYYEDGYSSYHPDTIDPSPWALVVTLSFCFTLILLLPLAVAVQQCLYRRRQKRKAMEDAAPALKASNRAHDIQEEKTTVEVLAEEKGMPVSSNNDFFSSSAAPFFFIEEEEDGEDDGSLYGLRSDNTKAFEDLWEDDLPPPRPSCPTGYKRAKGLAHLLQRAIGKHPKRDKTNSNQEEQTQSTNYVSMSDTTVPTHNLRRPPLILPTPKEDLLSFSYSESDGSPDLLAELVEEFENLNGMDENNEEEDNLEKQHLGYISESTTGSDPLPTHKELDQPSPIKNTTPRFQRSAFKRTTTTVAKKESVALSAVNKNKYGIDLCCGRRPWYAYFFSRGFLRKVRKCASWDEEMKKIGGLAIPYTLHAAITHVFALLEIVIIGQLIAGDNAKLLGAYFAIDFVLSLSTMLLDGIVNSLTVLCSHAVGARNFELAGKYVQLALLLHQTIFLPLVVLFWNHIDGIVIMLGFEEDEAAEAQAYGRFVFLTAGVEVFDTVIHHMLDVTGFAWYASLMDMTHALVSLLGVYAVGFFIIDPPLWMVGAIHLACSTTFCLLNGSIVVYKQWLLGFWTGFRSIALRDKRAVRTFFQTAGPLAFGYVVEYCEWEILFVLAAFQGPAEVAVWGLLGYIWEFAEYIGEAIADATEVRVANLLASQRPALARYSSHKSLFLGVMTSLGMASLILGLRRHLPSWLTTDETLQGMLSDLLPLVCVGLAALTFGSMSWTILCAQGRMRLATAVTLFGSVLITLPLSVVSTFVLNYNLQGLLASIVIGYGLSGIVNSFIMVTSKWERISVKVAKRNEDNSDKPKPKVASRREARPTNDMDYDASVEVELSDMNGLSLPDNLNTTADTSDEDESNSTYEDYDWEELPREVQDAAKLLGYSKRKWNNSIPTRFDDYDWKELTSAQRDAALILGYNEARWDAWETCLAEF